MHLLALEGEAVVGFVALKLHELDSYPDREHWLGSLYVPVTKRGCGIGGALIEEVILRSRAHGVTLLSLQTERLDGGIYRRYGWEDVERTYSRGDEVLIMERRIRQEAQQDAPSNGG
jgi:predicted N-acetyltransferase YhbS